MNRKQKQRNQNILDFVLSNYGSLEYLQIFIQENNIKDIAEFENAEIGTQYVVSAPQNTVLNLFEKTNHVVTTGDKVIYPPNTSGIQVTQGSKAIVRTKYDNPTLLQNVTFETEGTAELSYNEVGYEFTVTKSGTLTKLAIYENAILSELFTFIEGVWINKDFLKGYSYKSLGCFTKCLLWDSPITAYDYYRDTQASDSKYYFTNIQRFSPNYFNAYDGSVELQKSTVFDASEFSFNIKGRFKPHVSNYLTFTFSPAFGSYFGKVLLYQTVNDIEFNLYYDFGNILVSDSFTDISNQEFLNHNDYDLIVSAASGDIDIKLIVNGITVLNNKRINS